MDHPVIPTRPPTAAEVTEMVDETAKSVMRSAGRDPALWDGLAAEMRDYWRLMALERLRNLP